MNQLTRFTSLDLPQLSRLSVGFDEMFNRLNQRFSNLPTVNYPPYNVIRNTDTNYTIEVAVAGFSESELKITTADNALTVSGSKMAEAVDESVAQDLPVVLYRGISARDFSLTWPLAEHVEVVDAKFDNGMLRINLEQIIPESKKPKQIQISK